MFDHLHETAIRTMHENESRSLGPVVGGTPPSRPDRAAMKRWNGVAIVARRAAALVRIRALRPEPTDLRVSEPKAG